MRKIDLSDFQVASSETARDINRRILLNLIRRHQPLSRADLARRSGLKRNTVSVIVEQLIAEKWIFEGALGQSRRGRRPTFLHLNGNRAGVVGVDLRPNTTTIGLANLEFKFLALESMQTGSDPKKCIHELGKRIRQLTADHPGIQYEAIGISLPGRADLNTHELVFAPNLGWGRVDLKTPLEKATGLPVELENAANACALAELWSEKHHESVRNLVAVTISEGIGVGMVINGQLVRGATGLAGEFGHVVLDENGPECTCGNRGCWEVCGSNAAGVRYYQQALNSRKRITFEDLLDLAQQKDRRALHALERMGHWIGVGLAMLLTGLEPEMVIVIGSVTRAWEHIGPAIHAALQSRLPTRPKIRLLPTDPQSEPRLRGTIALALEKHFAAPMLA